MRLQNSLNRSRLAPAATNLLIHNTLGGADTNRDTAGGGDLAPGRAASPSDEIHEQPKHEPQGRAEPGQELKLAKKLGMPRLFGSI